MKEFGTPYGKITTGPQEEIYSKTVELLLTEASKRSTATVGLPGGATPKEWFKWMLAQKALEGTQQRICWLTSDERYVPTDSEESNFGNAARLFLDPLNVPETLRMPWPVNVDPYSASIVFNRRWNDRFGDHRCFDLCFMGLGRNGQIAGIFPQSPIVGLAMRDNFASVDVPQRGWRLTITDQGLRRCGKIILMVLGKEKAGPLQTVLNSPFDPTNHPSHLLREIADKVIWLVDDEAAAGFTK